MRAGVVIACASWLVACADATHTVGKLAAPAADGLPSSPAAHEAADAGRTQAQDAGRVASAQPPSGNAAGAAGAAPDASVDAGSPQTADPVMMLDDPPFSCQGTSTPAERRQLDLYLMVDTNIFYIVGTSITQPSSAWTQITRGLGDYVSDPRAAGTGVGAGYFPSAGEGQGGSSPLPACDASAYDSPTTPIATLPDNAAAIKAGIPLPLGLGSPTLAALEGASAYTESVAAAFQHKGAVVLITDNIADFACFTDPSVVPQQVVAAAAASLAQDPPIPVYVIALSAPTLEMLLTFLPFEALDDVAAEGGTDSAHHVNIEDPNTDQLAEALLEIQHDAEPCDFRVDDAVLADPSSTALGTTGASGGAIPLPEVAREEDCGQGYYVADDASGARWATLCPDTCLSFKASGRSAVWIAECDMP